MKYLLTMLFVSIAVTLMAASVTVASLKDLQQAINEARPGTVITLKNGVYTTSRQTNTKITIFFISFFLILMYIIDYNLPRFVDRPLFTCIGAHLADI